MTKNQTALLALLEAAGRPSSAADLARALGGACDLATVYRGLHRLEGAGLVEAFAFECRERGMERYYLSRSSPHRHFFHCEACHRFVDLGACRLGGLVGELEAEFGLEVEGHSLVLTGRCSACRAGEAGAEGAAGSAGAASAAG